MYDDIFLELNYGKLYQLDVHGLSLEEAKAEIVHTINLIDIDYKGILVVHGYHKGVVLKNFIRNKFEHKNVYKKVNLDVGRTILLVR